MRLEVLHPGFTGDVRFWENSDGSIQILTTPGGDDWSAIMDGDLLRDKGGAALTGTRDTILDAIYRLRGVHCILDADLHWVRGELGWTDARLVCAMDVGHSIGAC